MPKTAGQRLADRLNDISLVFPPLKNIVIEAFSLIGLIYLLARLLKTL